MNWIRFSRPRIETSRVNQLDTEILDDEIEHILTEPLFNSLVPSVISLGHPNLRPEFISLFKFIILRFSLLQSFTYGAKLENLRWVHGKTKKSLSRNQVTAYSLLAVLPSYLRTRVRDYMLSSGWADYPSSSNWSSMMRLTDENSTSRRKKYIKRFIWDMFERLELIYGGLDLINFLIFLFNGQYRSLLERYLGISFVYHRLDLRRNVSFEFLNRQLIWESITDFVLFILPFINFKRIRIRMNDGKCRLVNWMKQVMKDDTSNQVEKSKENKGLTSEKEEGKFKKLSNEICPICVTKRVQDRTKSGLNSNVIDPHDPMTFSSSMTSAANSKSVDALDDRVKIPYQVNCCHGLYCYYCLMTEMISWRENNLDQRWICWRCGKETRCIERWNGGV